MLERSLEMIIGIFGVLKSGDAYLLIDSSYRQERIDYILKDSGTKMMIGHHSAANLLFAMQNKYPN